ARPTSSAIRLRRTPTTTYRRVIRRAGRAPPAPARARSFSSTPATPSTPPPSSAIETTTTTEGVTVPFIIRQETGYIDRDQYAIATLWQPGKPWQPWAPQAQYNGRLVITHGASCDT